MALPFKHCDRITVGAEVELQILDRGHHDLAGLAPEVFRKLGDRVHIKPELFQAIVEINTGICNNPAEIRRDITRALKELRPVCDELDATLASAGSHPFARWENRHLYPTERYAAMADRVRWVLRRLLIFGLHVHLGMRDGDHAIAMMNAWLRYLPHLLALSASSPFWQGHDTGLASCRTTVFESLPTAGNPCVFRDWDDFERYFNAARLSGAISTIRDIWWDIRPHPDFGTIEIRICDALPTISETVSLVALAQCVTCWLDSRLRAGESFQPMESWLLRENKWRASRWGLEAELVADETGRTVALRRDLELLIDRIAPFAAELACHDDLARLVSTMTEHPSYKRQRGWFAEGRRLEDVARNLAMEFSTDQSILPVVPSIL